MTTPDPTPFPDGIDPEVWRFASTDDYNAAGEEDRFALRVDGWLRYFVRREPTPTMPPLPTEPGRVIRATTDQITTPMTMFRQGGLWYAIEHDGYCVKSDQITSWSPLTTDAETLEKVDVEALREVVREWWSAVVDTYALDRALTAFFARVARVDEVTGR